MPYLMLSIVSSTSLWLCDENTNTCSGETFNSRARRFRMRLLREPWSIKKCVVISHTAVWSSRISVTVVFNGLKTLPALAWRRLCPSLPALGVTENVSAAAYSMFYISRGQQWYVVGHPNVTVFHRAFNLKLSITIVWSTTP